MAVAMGMTYHACPECLIWHINGDDTGFCECTVECDSERCNAIKDAPGLQPGYAVVGTVDDEDGNTDTWFSMSRCDLCQRPGGGDRTAVATHHMG